ncbi:MAG: ribonuclease H-like domain-containing protein [Sedimentisphaerales bacterium]
MLGEKKIYDIKKLVGGMGWKAKDIAELYEVSESSAERYIRQAKVWEKPKRKAPNILLLDIETAPIEAYIWEIGYGLTINHYQVKHEWFILSWAAKWLLKDEIQSDVVTSVEAVDKDDSRICRSLWDVLEEAHIIIAHNAIKFDKRKVIARFMANGLPPFSPVQVIDTLRQSRAIAAFSSHKLDHLTKQFGLSQKDDTDFSLWVRCCEGNKEALNYMLQYNKSDILALEGLYLFLRPWMKSHPNMGVYCDHDGNICPSCGCESIDWRINEYYTPAGRYNAFRCLECGAIGRSRFNALTKEEKKVLTISTAR